MKNILVLGSEGQVGLSLSKYLETKKYNVTRFDIVRSLNEDLRIENVLDKILPDIDFVFFLAFDVGGSTYLEISQNSFEFIDNNMKLMVSTFNSLKKHNKNFIFTSSQMSNMTYSSYGVLKSIGEYYAKSLNGVIVKFWNVYGIENDEKKSHVITDFIKMSKSDKLIKIKTDGSEVRQFLHANDCSKCLEILMTKYDELDRKNSLDVTSFEWTTIREIAEIISELNNTNYEKGLKNDIQQNKQNEPTSYILNFWKPEIKLKDGIKLINDIL